MAITREDVLQAYRRILLREPESSEVIDHHVASSLTTYELFETLFNSPERQAHSGPLHKCFERDYLALDLDETKRVLCFTNNYRFLSECLKIEFLKQLTFGSIVLYSNQGGYLNIVVSISLSRDSPKEGELTIEYFANSLSLYILSFSFAPGGVVGLPHRSDIILVSRMQGRPGRIDELRNATKLMHEISPQATLFAVLLGIAEANQIPAIAGVAARNHISYDPHNADVLGRAYDNFFSSVGATDNGQGFFITGVPLVLKSITEIARGHRSRTKAKRESKRQIALAAAACWTGLRQQHLPQQLRQEAEDTPQQTMRDPEPSRAPNGAAHQSGIESFEQPAG